MTDFAKRGAALTALPAAALVAGVALAAALPGGGAAAPSGRAAAGVDPRSGGLQVALGEWAVGFEATVIRPGPVTFVVSNRGKVVHGLEIERVRGGDEDSGAEIDEETEKIITGRTERLTLYLTPGVYEVECFVSDHDERGMFLRLVVRADAPLLRPAANTANNVAIRNFAYAPKALAVKAGTTVRWRNADAAPHTVTGTGFGSDVLNRNGTYSRKFPRAGTFAYICALHPAMKGSVVVNK